MRPDGTRPVIRRAFIMWGILSTPVAALLSRFCMANILSTHSRNWKIIMNTRTRPEGQLNFYSIIASTLLSNFGSFLNMMALNILILQITNSAAWVGLVLGVRIISGMLVSPHLGVLSDRFDRKQLMLMSDFV